MKNSHYCWPKFRIQTWKINILLILRREWSPDYQVIRRALFKNQARLLHISYFRAHLIRTSVKRTPSSTLKWCFSCQKPLKNVKILDFCKKRARRAGRHSKNKKKFNDAIIRWYDFGTKKFFFFFPFALPPGAYVGSDSHILKNIRVVAWRQGVYLEKWTKVEEKFENHSGHLWFFLFLICDYPFNIWRNTSIEIQAHCRQSRYLKSVQLTNFTPSIHVTNLEFCSF